MRPGHEEEEIGSIELLSGRSVSKKTGLTEKKRRLDPEYSPGVRNREETREALTT